MNLLFTVCARAGSKGVVGKNIRTFCGYPIVYCTLEIFEKYLNSYRNANDIIDLAINTDSDQLIQQIKDKGTDCIFIDRKKELAGDEVAKGDVIRDTLFTVEKIRSERYDIVVDLDITSPLRELSDVRGTIDLVVRNMECNFAYSVVESRRNPYFNMVCKNESGFYDRVIPSSYTTRQQTPTCFDMNASIYAYARDYLLDMRTENRRALIWTMKDSGVLDIDNKDDFEIMEVLTQYYWKQGRYLDIKTGFV